MTRKLRTLRSVRPSAAIEQQFSSELHKLIEEMQRSIVWWLSAAYRSNPPEMAMDASPARTMRRVVARLTKRWQTRFDEAAPKLAEYFTTKIGERSDAVLKRSLREGGISVKMQMTPVVTDVLQATMNEQVSLIKSIAAQHLQEVEGLVMRSVSAGGDLSTLSDQLRARYGVTRRRAELIARDQNSKATAMIQRARQDDLGIEEAVWKHSHAGKTPRPSHVAADGTVYRVKEGLVLDGERTWPGVQINCRCFSKPVLPELTSKGL